MTALEQLEQLKRESEQLRVELAEALEACRKVQAGIERMYSELAPRKDEHWLLFPLDIAWPVSGEFGEMYTIGAMTWQHEGIDLACPAGCGVRACASGVVKFAGVKVGYGNFVQIEHQHDGVAGWKTGYAHLGTIECRAGQAMIAKQFIGLSGETGNVCGAHLHLNVWTPYSTFKPAGCSEYLRGVDDPRDWVQFPEQGWHSGQ